MQQEIQRIIQHIGLEEKEQQNRFKKNKEGGLKQLKAEGVVLHPISVTQKSFGFADYPEISFSLLFAPEVSLFKDGAAIELFYDNEESVKGVLLSLENKRGTVRLFAPDFPDWIDQRGVGIQLVPDTRTTTIMRDSMKQLPDSKKWFPYFEEWHGEKKITSSSMTYGDMPVNFFNSGLNSSQQQAVKGILENNEVSIIHGPPGTGKTTTLVEAILQLVRRKEKVLVSAPSNTAVDHIARGLATKGINLLRVGNNTKIDEAIFKFTVEGKLQQGKQLKEIKELKIRAEQFRKMALKYKRSFGKAEREQRKLLFQEVKNIRTEIKKLQHYNEQKLFAEAEVILGTPIGLYDAGLKKEGFQTLIIDEAGQCLEPLAWCIIPLAEKLVLAGDHLQLPPTVLSNEAARNGFNRSILETALPHSQFVFLLDTQYRMRPAIAGFSSAYFYENLLKTSDSIKNEGLHITFIDTAGTGFEETEGNGGGSLQNTGEARLVQFLLKNEIKDATQTAVIAPYAGQVAALKELLATQSNVNTIDSFQGQEKDTIIISLVRSNDDGVIGFLKDYRRMNVAITRAKNQLIIIGDSATIGADQFYKSLLSYIEKNGVYKTAWEYELLQ